MLTSQIIIVDLIHKYSIFDLFYVCIICYFVIVFNSHKYMKSLYFVLDKVSLTYSIPGNQLMRLALVLRKKKVEEGNWNLS